MSSDQLLELGKNLLSMGQKILDTHESGASKKKDHKDSEEEPEAKGKVLGIPNKALIVASLKRKIG